MGRKGLAFGVMVLGIVGCGGSSTTGGGGGPSGGGGSGTPMMSPLAHPATGTPTKKTMPQKPTKSFTTIVSAPPSRPTTPPPSMPQPMSGQQMRSIAGPMLSYESSAAQLKSSVGNTSCSDFGLNDGEGYCYIDSETSYLVFCDKGTAWAFDCGAFGANIACNVDYSADVVECAAAPAAQIDPALLADQSYAATIGSCAPQENLSAACDNVFAMYCQDGTLYEVDCSAFTDSQGVAATCGTINGNISCGWAQ
jgi:hypothetical protein